MDQNGEDPQTQPEATKPANQILSAYEASQDESQPETELVLPGPPSTVRDLGSTSTDSKATGSRRRQRREEWNTGPSPF
jgi:hypothetical protein